MAPTHSKPIDKNMYAKSSPSKNSSKLSKRPRFILSCWGFPPLCIEAYVYRKGTDRDGYGNHYRKCVDGDEQCKELDEAGFAQYFTRRISKEQNIPLVGADEWACFVYVRWVPGMNPSTTQTRVEGLSFFRKYLMDNRYSRYPPNDIMTMDLTDVVQPRGMDHLFLDEHIMLFIKDLFQPSIANERFFTEHNVIAKLFFGSAPYPPEATMLYGFGNALPVAPAAEAIAVSQPDKPDGPEFDTNGDKQKEAETKTATAANEEVRPESTKGVETKRKPEEGSEANKDVDDTKDTEEDDGGPKKKTAKLTKGNKKKM